MIIDSNVSCLGKADFLKSKGVRSVGRYYRHDIHPDWAITKAEAQELSRAGLSIFVTYEDTGHRSQMILTEAQGLRHGGLALDQARAIGQPRNGVIYFAVEGLDDGYGQGDLEAIKLYFSGVNKALAGHYRTGVYGDGLVCKTLLEGFCTFTWLAASMGFAGSRDFHANGPWNLFQTVPIDQTDGWGGLSVDVNEGRGDYGAFTVPFT